MIFSPRSRRAMTLKPVRIRSSAVLLRTAVDGAPDAVVALKDPNSLFEGSSAQNPYQMANDGVKVGFDIMNGKAPKDKVKLLPVPLVTKANLKDYPGWVKE